MKAGIMGHIPDSQVEAPKVGGDGLPMGTAFIRFPLCAAKSGAPARPEPNTL
jgi:hypothetical protein